MLNSALLFGFVAIAAWTDLRVGKIYNKITYPGILTALLLSAAASLLGIDAEYGTDSLTSWIGALFILHSLAGFLVCGGLMTVCYVLFAGGIGGGDIKLVAMIGAFYGVMVGVEAMLWTFALAACAGVISLIWQVGAWELLKRALAYPLHILRYRARPALREEDRQPLKTKLYLGPSALAAVIIIIWRLFGPVGSWGTY